MSTTSEVELHSGAYRETHHLVTYASQGQQRGLVLYYDSQRADPQEIVHLGFDQLDPTQATDRSLVARITVPEVLTEEHAFTVAAGATRADAAVQLDFRSQPTGVYRYQGSLAVTGGSTGLVQDEIVVVNSATSPFGAGWGIGDLYELHPTQTGSLLLVSGDGSEAEFLPPTKPEAPWTGPPGDTSTLRQNLATGVFVRRLKDGTEYEFDLSLRVRFVRDRNGNTTEFVYQGERLARIIDPVGLATTFSYASREVRITDPANRVTVLRLDERGDLREIQDPDGSRRRFDYEDDSHLLVHERTKLGFDEWTQYRQGRVVRAVRADGSEMDIQPAQLNGLFDPEVSRSGSGSTPPTASALPLQPMARIVDSRGSTRSLTLNQAGETTGSQDEVGTLATFERNAKGQITSAVDARDLNRVVTSYDVQGNRTSVKDNVGEKTATFEPVFSRIVSETDELGRVTTYQRDARGNLLRVTRTNRFGPDDVTSYTYTAAGLLDTVTDALGRITDDDYDAWGRLTKSTVAKGTADEATRQFVYDDLTGNLAASIDSRGQRTDYEYDALNRLVRETGPDPDGPGPLTPQTTEWRYDQAGNVTSQIDTLGRITEYAYDRLGRRIRITESDPDGLGPLTPPVTEYTFDANGNLILTRDALGRVVTCEYDARNRRIATIGPMVVDAAGRETYPTTRYVYDADDHPIQVSDPEGRVTRSEYDERGRLVAETQEDRAGGTLVLHTRRYIYDAADRLVAQIDENGKRADYVYDDLDRLLQEISPDPDGPSGPLSRAITSYTYDAVGNRLTGVDPRGNELNAVAQFTTTYQYDNRDRPIAETGPDPDGTGPLLPSVTRYAYDAAGNRTQVTDARGCTTDYAYDGLNRLTEVTDPDATCTPSATGRPVTHYGYDQAGNLRFITDARGNQIERQYDALDRQVKTVDSLGGVYQWQYDAAGQVIAQIDELGRRTSYEYDSLGRRVETTDQLNQTSHVVYDLAGNKVSTTDASGETTRAFYDDLGRLTRFVDGQGGVSRYEYDLVGNLVAIADAAGNTTRFRYDGRNRLVAETISLPEGDAVRSYTYDVSDNHTSTTDRNGRTTRYSYDAVNRLISEEWLNADGTALNTITYAYGATDLLTRISDSYATDSYTHDGLENRTSVSNAGTPGAPAVVLTYAYDGESNLISRVDTIGGAAAGRIDYTYDELNRLSRISHRGNGVGTKRIDFAYDLASQWTRLSRYDDLDGTHLIASSDYTFDAAGRLQQLVHRRANQEVLADYAWTFDAAGRVTRATSPDGTTAYQYDAADRLVGADHSYQADEQYSYDALGNRTNSGYQTGVYNRLLSDGTHTYEYDREGNRTKRTETATGRVTEYEWDYRNRLVRVVERTSSAGPITTETLYVYDALDKRIAKSVDPDGTGTLAASVERYVYDGENLAYVFNDAGALLTRYLYGPAADQLLAEEDAAGHVRWALADRQGSIRDVIDSSGAVLNHIVYDSFGRVTSQTVPPQGIRFLYTGREFDAETGLYNYRARYYDAALGSFLSEDPLGLRTNALNLYSYVGASPTQATDPTGREAWVEDAGYYAQSNAFRLAETFMNTSQAMAMGVVAAPAMAAIGGGVGFVAGLGGYVATPEIAMAVSGYVQSGIGAYFAIQYARHLAQVPWSQLDSIGLLDEILPALAGMGTGIAASRVCPPNNGVVSSFRFGKGVSLDYVFPRIKRFAARNFRPGSVVTQRGEQVLRRVMRQEKIVEVGIRNTDRFTAAGARLGQEAGLNGKTCDIKAKTGGGVIRGSESGELLASDWDFTYMKRADGTYLTDAEVLAFKKKLNPMLAEQGYGQIQQHGSHFTMTAKQDGPCTYEQAVKIGAPGGADVIKLGEPKQVLTAREFYDRIKPDLDAGNLEWLPEWEVPQIRGRIDDPLSTVAFVALTDAVLLASSAGDAWEWIMPGLVPADISILVADLPGQTLAQSGWIRSSDHNATIAPAIVVDGNAAGIGWFIDRTPLSNREFSAQLTEHAFLATPESAAAKNYDLLTVLAHEIGHLLGFVGEQTHVDTTVFPDDLMGAELPVGTRRLPSAADAAVLHAATPIEVGMGFAGALTAEGEPAEVIVNGDFAVSNPLDPGFGATTQGDAAVVGQQAAVQAEADVGLPQTAAGGESSLREGLLNVNYINGSGPIPEGDARARAGKGVELARHVRAAAAGDGESAAAESFAAGLPATPARSRGPRWDGAGWETPGAASLELDEAIAAIAPAVADGWGR